MSRVVGVAAALPPHVHTQEEITEAIGPLLTGDPTRLERLRSLHAASGVRTRHTVLPLERYATLTSFSAANDTFIDLGADLARQAAADALGRAGLAPRDVDLLVFTSVTGVSAPSLDALLVPRLGMRDDVRRVPSFGWGCAGGAAGLALVHDYLAGHPRAVALLVSVELCSLTIQHGDDSMANLVSSGLFGDGAAAVVMVGAEHHAARGSAPQVLGSLSRLYPDTAGHLGWQVAGSGFRVVLAAGLPGVLADHLAPDVARLLEAHDLKVRDVAAWVVHAGGPRILDAVQEVLDLDEDALALSRASLAAVGNLSSASVLHVLAAHLDRPPVGGGVGVLVAFGPGVAAEYVLLGWPA